MPDELEKTKVGEAMINKPSDEDKRLFIKNWIENIPKTLLVKYFNTWKIKDSTDKNIEDIIKTNKKKIIKKRVINLQKIKKMKKNPRVKSPKTRNLNFFVRKG